MRTITSTRVITAVVAVAGLAAAAPVAAAPAPADPGDGTGVVLRRDASQAEPFRAEVGQSAAPTLRRDGSQAVPFVANVGPAPASSPTSSSAGFDWGDAAIGAASALGLILLAGTARSVSRRRRDHELRPTVAA